METNCLPRVADSLLNRKLCTFGATCIIGPRGAGKTTLAERQAKSSVKFQDATNKESLRTASEIAPKTLLKGEHPRLIDEWQEAPSIWDAVRAWCDRNGGTGHFILTSSSAKKVKVSHTGTGRISELRLYPMSLFESGESNGTVSLKALFDDPLCLKDGCQSSLSLEELIFASCRGGWPAAAVLKNSGLSLQIARDYFTQIYSRDIFQVDQVKRRETLMKTLLRSYARNVSTLASASNLLSDVKESSEISIDTLNDYLDVLRRLYIIDEVESWCPAIRSKSAIRGRHKRAFVDPSLAVAALGVSPEFFQNDLMTYGFIFECLCLRDLQVYSYPLRGEISYYSDRYGLQADCVLHMPDGRYALIDYKLGGNLIKEGASQLNKIESLIAKKNQTEKRCFLRPPDLKLIITGGRYGYRRPDGVYIVPIGCLRD